MSEGCLCTLSAVLYKCASIRIRDTDLPAEALICWWAQAKTEIRRREQHQALLFVMDLSDAHAQCTYLGTPHFPILALRITVGHLLYDRVRDRTSVGNEMNISPISTGEVHT